MAKLIVAHNLSEGKLHFAEKMGGLACPSLAIIRNDIPFTSYGPISLIPNKELINPENIDVFNGDVYSSRFPNIFYKADDAELESLVDNFKEASLLINDDISFFSLVNEIERGGTEGLIKRLKDEYVAKVSFLLSKGINPEIKSKDCPVSHPEAKVVKIQQWCKKNNASAIGWDDPKLLELGELLRIEYEKASDLESVDMATNKREPGETYQQVYDEVFPMFYEERINNLKATPRGFVPHVVTICELVSDIKSLDNSPVIFDSHDFSNRYDDFFSNNEDEFQSWLLSLSENTAKDPWFYSEGRSGPEKKVASMKNIVAEMSLNIRDSEVGSLGVGQVRSLVARKLESFEHIESSAINIVSDKEFEIERDLIGDKFHHISDQLRSYYKFNGERIGFRDEVCSSLKDYIRKGPTELSHYYNELPEYLIDEIDEFIDSLRDAKTGYFEAKLNRSVSLDEFRYAVIPDSLSDKTKELLRKNNLEIIEYVHGNENSRIKAMKEVKSMSFGSLPDSHIQKDNDSSLSY